MDNSSKIKELADLRDTGIISSVDFENAKEKILKSSNHSTMAPSFPPQSHAPPVYRTQNTMIIANNQPDVLIAYLLWFFVGGLGIHHLYMGRGVLVFILALVTFQGFLLLWIADLFLIPSSCAKVRNPPVIQQF